MRRIRHGRTALARTKTARSTASPGTKPWHSAPGTTGTCRRRLSGTTRRPAARSSEPIHGQPRPDRLRSMVLARATRSARTASAIGWRDVRAQTSYRWEANLLAMDDGGNPIWLEIWRNGLSTGTACIRVLVSTVRTLQPKALALCAEGASSTLPHRSGRALGAQLWIRRRLRRPVILGFAAQGHRNKDRSKIPQMERKLRARACQSACRCRAGGPGWPRRHRAATTVPRHRAGSRRRARRPRTGSCARAAAAGTGRRSR